MAATIAERPIKFCPRLSIGDETMPMIQLHSGLHWFSADLMKNMAVGHDVEALTHFFTTMNLSDASALYHAVNHAASLGSLLAPPPPAKPQAPNIRAQTTSHDELQSMQDETDGAESRFWDMETGIASFRTTFDPASRRRLSVIANARQANFYGVHPEEFQVRSRAASEHARVRLDRAHPRIHVGPRLLPPISHPAGKPLPHPRASA
jgi:hypothetical protein